MQCLCCLSFYTAKLRGTVLKNMAGIAYDIAQNEPLQPEIFNGQFLLDIAAVLQYTVCHYFFRGVAI